MKTSVAHVRKHPFDVCCGRAGFRGERHMLNTKPGVGGWLGNPYRVEDFERYGDGRKLVIALFEEQFVLKLATDPAFKAAVLALRGKRLGCWCVDDPWQPGDGGELICHAMVVAKWVDGQFAICKGK